MKKILVINHSYNTVYGAAKSLRLLIMKSNFLFDMIYPFAFRTGTAANDVRNFYGENVQHVYCLPMTFKLDEIIEQKEVSIRKRLSNFVHEGLALLTAPCRKVISRKKEYDYIHLNSLILFPLIDEKSKYIIHVREVFQSSDEAKKRIVQQLNRAAGVVYIGEAEKKPFADIKVPSIVLTNPFDMRYLKNYSQNEIYKKYSINKDTVIIAMLGMITFEKGVLRVIKAFEQTTRQDVVLLVVGKNDGSIYTQECLKHIGASDSMIYIGELSDPGEIYCVADYVVRGEDYVGVGRTVYEALFSKCDVIMYDEERKNLESIQSESEIFADRVHTYSDEKSLTAIMEQVHKVDKVKREYLSNTEQYVRKYENFVEACCAGKD